MALPNNQQGSVNGITQYRRGTYWATNAEATANRQWLQFDNETDRFGYYNYPGSPEGNVAADIGSYCSDTTNGRMYLKTTDTVATGWVLVVTGTVPTIDLHTARYIVSPNGTTDGANFTTIAAAYAQAVADGGKQTVYIQPKSTNYVENLTLSANVNLAALPCDSQSGSVTIQGKLTATFSGTCSITGIRFQTNGDNILATSGASATNINFINCEFSLTNATAFSLASSGGGVVYFQNCEGNTSTTGITYFSATNTNGVIMYWSIFYNDAASTTASTFANACQFTMRWSSLYIPVTTSNTATVGIEHSQLLSGGAISLTHGGTGNSIVQHSRIGGAGAFAAITIGVGALLPVMNSVITGYTPNIITGAGTIQFSNLTFDGTGSTITTTTRTRLVDSDTKLVLLSSQTASASANINFTSVITASYSSYMLVITNMIPATNTANLQMLYSANNGSSYLVTNYLAGTLYNAVTGTTFSNANSTTDGRMSGPISNAGFLTGTYFLTGFSSAGFGFVRGQSTWNDTTLTAYATGNTNIINNGTTAINAIRLQMSAGNITAGTFTLYGIKES